MAPPPYSALQRDGGGNFIFHLNKRSTDRGHASREALDHFCRRRDGISGGESRAGRQRAFATGVVAVEEVRAG
ncbi:MAG TPA: hypothetical protein VGK96_22830 [Candidatus Sulfotelmatobacter sp.]